MEWISVKDKLPKDGCEVLAYYNPDGWLPVILICFLENGEWYSQDGDNLSCQESLINWMPLPEPPKK